MKDQFSFTWSYFISTWTQQNWKLGMASFHKKELSHVKMGRAKYLISDGLIDRGFHFIPQKEQNYIAKYARLRGIQEYDYSRKEYTNLRKLAKKAHLDKALIEKFDRGYCFTHIMAKKLRTGAHNSITGICYDAAICSYAVVARIIEKRANSGEVYD